MSTEAPAVDTTGAPENEAPELSYETRRAEAFKERFGEEPAPRQTANEAPAADENAEETPAVPPKPAVPQARKPYQHAVPPDRVEHLLRQRDQRIIELETENRLAREGRLNPAQQQQEQPAPKAPARPNPVDFKNEDGTFDEDGYVDALTEHATNKALAKLNETLEERQQRANEEAEQAEIIRVSTELANDFHGQAREIIESPEIDPEVREDMKAAIGFLTSDQVASHIPLQIQHELMRAGPRVAYLLAQDQRLINVLVSGDVVSSAKLIVTAQQYLKQVAPAQSASNNPSSNNMMQGGSLESPAPRQPNGQYAPRPQPRGPVEIDGVPSVNTGNDYESHRQRKMRENGWV